MLLSGNDHPIDPYEERVIRTGGAWHGGNSSNGPMSESVWTEDDAVDSELYDASFWVDVDSEADAVRVAVAGPSGNCPGRVATV